MTETLEHTLLPQSWTPDDEGYPTGGYPAPLDQTGQDHLHTLPPAIANMTRERTLPNVPEYEPLPADFVAADANRYLDEVTNARDERRYAPRDAVSVLKMEFGRMVARAGDDNRPDDDPWKKQVMAANVKIAALGDLEMLSHTHRFTTPQQVQETSRSEQSQHLLKLKQVDDRRLYDMLSNPPEFTADEAALIAQTLDYNESRLPVSNDPEATVELLSRRDGLLSARQYVEAHSESSRGRHTLAA